jgi:riboflavin biosynthesis pyrimidine reductase
LRDWADGRAQEILLVDDPRFADLRTWRKEKGLPPQPDIAIVSGSLKFPIPDVLKSGGRKVVVFTTADPPIDRVKEIEAKAGQVIIAGEQSVDGQKMAEMLYELGYRTVYSAAGPKILHLLLNAGVVNRLYISFASRILGGQPYASLVEGALFNPAVDLVLNQLYLDASGVDGSGQLFAVYDKA